MLTPRLKQIIEAMLLGDEVISVKQLAEMVGVSKRTIQRELEYINSSLKSYGITFESKTGVGVWLNGSAEDKEALLQEISSEERYDAANREERRKRLTLEILREKGLKKLFVYSSKFKVSEATISADLEVVEEWLNKFGMKVVRKPGSGIYVDGTEKEYRRAIRSFVHENLDTKVMWEAYEKPFEMSSSYDVIKKSGIGQMLDEKILQQVVDCITELNHEHIQSLTENSYMGLVIHIAIAIHRILQGEDIEEDKQLLEEIAEDRDYEVAEDITWALEEAFDIEIPEMEIAYICIHIKGAKHENVYWEGKKKIELDNKELKTLLNDMIYAFDSEKAYLLRRDEEFIQGLLAHLQPTLIRLSYGLEIQNPILDGIQRDYSDIYRKCERVAKVIESWNGKRVPEAEIGFLTVHFGAAIVRAEGKLENIRPVKVAVVCSSGIGISRLMSSKLSKIFQDRMIIKTYGKRDMTPFEQQKYDFCITSIRMDTLDIPLIEVNPLLTDEDVEGIRKYVQKYERMPKKQKEETVGFVDQMEEVQNVATQINHIIRGLEFHCVNADISFMDLLEDIADKLSPYEDQRKLIKESILEREKISTQIYAEFEFALLHARTDGTTNPVFGIWMTEKLTPFEAPDFKKIKIAFVMLVPMDENLKVNSEIMGYISSLLVEDNTFMDIVESGYKETIRNALSKHLKKFFSSYLSNFTED